MAHTESVPPWRQVHPEPELKPEPNPNMPTFHPFPRLPVEIRLLIWEASVEHREVAVGYGLMHRWRSPPPALLHACSEARSCLQRKYFKVFGFDKTLPAHKCHYEREPLIYTWVNVDIDTVYCGQDALNQVIYELPYIRWLMVEAYDPEAWYLEYSYGCILNSLSGDLEHLTIIHHCEDSPDQWRIEWEDWMESCYFTFCRFPFHTRVILPGRAGHPIGEMNSDNFLESRDRGMQFR